MQFQVAVRESMEHGSPRQGLRIEPMRNYASYWIDSRCKLDQVEPQQNERYILLSNYCRTKWASKRYS